jgi:hypothetical protein
MQRVLSFLVFLALTCGASPLAAQGMKMAEGPPDPTNSLFDNSETVALPGPTSIQIDGEIANPGAVDLKSLPLRSVIVKEMALKGGKPTFVGAYRYDGYALDDVLDRIVLQKKNRKEFPSIIDAYIEVSNAKGESAVISWLELNIPVHRHEILIATQAMHIVPAETGAQWPIPTETRLIVSSDLLSERNIPAPSRITVRSLDDPVKRDNSADAAFSPELLIVQGGQAVAHVTALTTPLVEYPTVFYGRGQGNHEVYSMKGALLRDVLKPYVPVTTESLRRGMLTVAGKDGFRAAYTVSEVMNRSDQAEVLLVDAGKTQGRFRLFPSGDFLSSDRAVHTLAEIRYVVLK